MTAVEKSVVFAVTGQKGRVTAVEGGCMTAVEGLVVFAATGLEGRVTAVEGVVFAAIGREAVV